MKFWQAVLLIGAVVYLIQHYWDWLVKKWAEAHGVDTRDWDK